jgi:hypothetical protein
VPGDRPTRSDIQASNCEWQELISMRKTKHRNSAARKRWLRVAAQRVKAVLKRLMLLQQCGR